MNQSMLKNQTMGIFYFLILTFALIPAPFLAFSQIPSDREVLLNAEGAGQAKYAEMNGYPGPKHVLELAEKLQLTPDQRKNVEKIFKEMETRSKEIGKTIIKVETEFNDAFKNGLVSETSVQGTAEQIGKLRGKLRAVHLNAHLKTKMILNETQIVSYKQLRGIGKENVGQTGHEGHGH